MKENSRRSVQLGYLFTIKHGYAFKGEHFGKKGSHIVLTPGNFFDEGGFKKKGDKEKWYSGKIPEEYILSQGDILVAMTEQAEGLLGSAALVPKNDIYLHNQRLGLIQDLNGVEKRFLYYLFNSKLVRQQIRASCSGVKVRHTSPSRIYEVKVDIPPLPTQRKIAAILSAYDDLIETNLRRIKILEEMSQNLYREWFVKFHFPGYQNARFTDSPLGRIPTGWEVVYVEQIVKRAPSGKKYNQKTVSPTLRL
ncbi:MAG: restriction endonuclease subunit S, partial [Acidobacteriota bacterium]